MKIMMRNPFNSVSLLTLVKYNFVICFKRTYYLAGFDDASFGLNSDMTEEEILAHMMNHETAYNLIITEMRNNLQELLVQKSMLKNSMKAVMSQLRAQLTTMINSQDLSEDSFEAEQIRISIMSTEADFFEQLEILNAQIKDLTVRKLSVEHNHNDYVVRAEQMLASVRQRQQQN